MDRPLRSFAKIIITGGPTREWLDPVRFISNASTGKMGLALVKAACRYSDNVVFIHGPLETAVDSREFSEICVETTQEMKNAVLDSIGPDSLLIMAAAPADYAPVEKASRKIKKDHDALILELKKTPDILKAVHEKRVKESIAMKVIGFAAETHDAVTYALGKIESKGLDAICVNDLTKAGAGFGVDTNIISMIFSDGFIKEIPLMSKEDAAEEIFAAAVERMVL